LTRSISHLALAAALAVGCTCAVPPAPTLDSISPGSAPTGAATLVTVHGTGFAPWVQADLDAPEDSTVRGGFALALLAAGGRVPLEGVVLVSDREIAATVPAGAAAVLYDLELLDPRGRTAVLPGAFAVGAADPGCVEEGAPCDDGNACTQEDTCHAGLCTPGASSCRNTAPIACLTVTPAAAEAGAPFTFDASCSSDAEEPTSSLEARFDHDGDGVWGTAFASAAGRTDHVYPAPGLYVATVEVRDSGGLSAFASRYALVAAPGDLVVVTTSADEDDPGATPGAPGGTGLSLREAVTHVNGLGAPRTILIGVAEPITHASPLPALVVPGTRIAGAPGATLLFPGVNQACVKLDAADLLLLGLTISGCTNAAVLMTPRSGGSQVAESFIGPAPTAKGIVGEATGIIGPRNEIASAWKAVEITGSYVVEENRIHANDRGILADGGTAIVRRNLVHGNGLHGLQATARTSWCTVIHNVFAGNGGDGVVSASLAGGLVARNNLFTRNGGFGIRSGSAGATIDHNGFFANALGALSSAEPAPSDLVSDPLYGGGLRLSPMSPAIDRGTDTGLDVNGPAAGNYDGAAPDLGAWEAPYPAP
jgi:hypothetical protein